MADPARLVNIPNSNRQTISFDPIEIRHAPLTISLPRPSPWTVLQSGSRIGDLLQSRSTPSPWGLVTRFFLPWTNKSSSYQSGDFYTEKMSKHPAVDATRSLASEELSQACRLNCNPLASGRIQNDLGKNSFLTNVKDFGSTIVGFATFGFLGKDPYYGVVGSFGSRSSWNSSEVDCRDGTAKLEMSIQNSMSAESLTRYGYGSANDTILSNDPLGSTGPLGTMQQSWKWTESIRFNPNESCPE